MVFEKLATTSMVVCGWNNLLDFSGGGGRIN